MEQSARDLHQAAQNALVHALCTGGDAPRVAIKGQHEVVVELQEGQVEQVVGAARHAFLATAPGVLGVRNCAVVLQCGRSLGWAESDVQVYEQ